MRDRFLAGLSVRPVVGGERDRFDAELDGQHWLGHRLVGETVRHVAVGPDGSWVALVGYGSAALACGARDRRIGWADDVRFRRLRYVVNNQRYCVLGEDRRGNLASAVLARSLRRVSGDYEARYGHRVLWVETFVDPARHRGSCYLGAGFEVLGETAGYGRSAGRWHHHGVSKLYLAYPLHRDAAGVLAAPFDHPLLQRKGMVIDLNVLDFDSTDGLLARLDRVVDHRKARGVRHGLASILAIATAATLAGARSVAAIGEYAADCPQEVLGRLGAKYHPTQRRFIAPHPETFRRALGKIDTDMLDRVVGGWLFDQVRAGLVDEDALVVLAVDGKSMRGARRGDGRAVHLFSAMVHDRGVVVGQHEVDEKSNEITAFRPVLENLDIDGALVTADALHTQRDHARFLVEEKHADYLFRVKDNQPNLNQALRSMDPDVFSPEHESTSKGHGRIEHRYVRVADIPDGVDFPHAKQVIVVYRERADLNDVLLSSETSYYITSVDSARGGAEQLGGHVRGHWGIENKVHWVRDWTFDEDRHQFRTTSSTPARSRPCGT